MLLVVLAAAAIVALQGWILRDPVRGVLLGFFTSGILLTPHLPVVRDKFTATELVFLLVWFALLCRRGASRGTGPIRREQQVSVVISGIFMCWMLLSFCVNNIVYGGQQPWASTLVPSAVETANLLYGYLIFVTVVLLARDPGIWQRSLDWWVAGATVVVFFGVWALIGSAPGWAVEEGTHRVSSTLRNENQVPSYLLPVFVAMIFMAVRKGNSRRYQYWMWALVAAAVAISVGTGSRTALLMLLLSWAGVFYIATRRLGYRPYRVGALAQASVALSTGIVLYVLLALAAYDGHYSLLDTPAWQRPVAMFYEWLSGHQPLDTARSRQLTMVAEEIDQHLLLGTGPKVYSGLFSMEEVHNTYAGVLRQTGIIGLLLFLLWLGHLLWYTRKYIRRIEDPYQKVLVLSLLVGMGTLLLYNMAIFGLRQRTIWLLAGLLVASWSFARRPARARMGAIGADGRGLSSPQALGRGRGI